MCSILVCLVQRDDDDSSSSGTSIGEDKTIESDEEDENDVYDL